MIARVIYPNGNAGSSFSTSGQPGRIISQQYETDEWGTLSAMSTKKQKMAGEREIERESARIFGKHVSKQKAGLLS